MFKYYSEQIKIEMRYGVILVESEDKRVQSMKMRKIERELFRPSQEWSRSRLSEPTFGYFWSSVSLLGMPCCVPTR